jgi:serine/threonine protein phosphatase PrpC
MPRLNSTSATLNRKNTAAQLVSVTASRGYRTYMEDSYYVSRDARFTGVFDGHGGDKVSAILRADLYKAVVNILPEVRDGWKMDRGKKHGSDIARPSPSQPDLPEAQVSEALGEAIKRIDKAVCGDRKLERQGSTCVTVLLQPHSIYSANVGDSRAVLCRRGRAIDLTTDHKPNSAKEKAYIEKLGK